MIALSRRQFLSCAGAGVVLSLSGCRVSLRSSTGATDPSPRYTGWVRDGAPKVVGGSLADPRAQLMWTTLMRVDNRITGALDRWYLWCWTHDAPLCRLFSAPSARGPYTYRGFCKLPSPPPGWNQRHFSSGDVVWDPVSKSFYSTPHSARIVGGLVHQATFLIRSSDGRDWDYVRSDPIVPWGRPGSFDQYHAGYGRFLRDFHGNLVRVGGRAHWYYRGQRLYRPGGYSVGLATSSDLMSWSKYPREPLFHPQNEVLHAIGSALWSNGRVYLVLAVKDVPPTMFIKGSANTNDPYRWTDGPGVAVYQQGGTLFDGGCYVLDDEGVHSMTLVSLRVIDARNPVHGRGEVVLIRSPSS